MIYGDIMIARDAIKWLHDKTLPVDKAKLVRRAVRRINEALEDVQADIKAAREDDDVDADERLREWIDNELDADWEPCIDADTLGEVSAGTLDLLVRAGLVIEDDDDGNDD